MEIDMKLNTIILACCTVLCVYAGWVLWNVFTIFFTLAAGVSGVATYISFTENTPDKLV